MATGLQRLGVRLEVTKAALNHISGTRGGITEIYQRHSWLEGKRPPSMSGVNTSPRSPKSGSRPATLSPSVA
jgi:hypothetical protein